MNLDKTQVFCQVEAPEVAFQSLALKMCYSGKKKVQLFLSSLITLRVKPDPETLIPTQELEDETQGVDQRGDRGQCQHCARGH